jgi:solute carrier family 25 protein 34/35
MSRLQLQGELQSKKQAPRLYKGVFHGVKVILQNEGPKGLFRGFGAAASHSWHITFAQRLT